MSRGPSSRFERRRPRVMAPQHTSRSMHWLAGRRASSLEIIAASVDQNRYIRRVKSDPGDKTCCLEPHASGTYHQSLS